MFERRVFIAPGWAVVSRTERNMNGEVEELYVPCYSERSLQQNTEGPLTDPKGVRPNGSCPGDRNQLPKRL